MPASNYDYRNEKIKNFNNLKGGKTMSDGTKKVTIIGIAIVVVTAIVSVAQTVIKIVPPILATEKSNL